MVGKKWCGQTDQPTQSLFPFQKMKRKKTTNKQTSFTELKENLMKPVRNKPDPANMECPISHHQYSLQSLVSSNSYYGSCQRQTNIYVQYLMT